MTHQGAETPGNLDDHAFAAWAADRAGARLLAVRAEGLEGRELKDAGDAAAQELLAGLLAEHRPGDSVLSEEASDDKSRLQAERVWIIDPSTAPASSPSRRATTGPSTSRCGSGTGERGELSAGAVAQPALGETFHTGTPPEVPARTSDRPRIAVSRTRPPAFVQALADEIGAELVPMGSAGVKVMSVVRDVADAYVARRRAVPVGQRRPRRRRPCRRPALLPRRRLAAGLQRGRHLAARPHRLPSRAGRHDRGVRPPPRHRLSESAAGSRCSHCCTGTGRRSA